MAKNMALVSQLPYFPEFAPCEFLLFPRMESQLRGCYFQYVPQIQEQSLTTIPKGHSCSASSRATDSRLIVQTHMVATWKCTTRNKLSSYFIVSSFCKLLNMPLQTYMHARTCTHMHTRNDFLVTQHNGALQKQNPC